MALTETEQRALDAWVPNVEPSDGQTFAQALAVEASSFVAAYELDHGHAPEVADVEAALRERSLP